MIRNILLALDGSRASESALPYVETLLRSVDADVTLALAVPGLNLRREKVAAAYLHGVENRLTRKGAIVRSQVLREAPAKAIAEAAENHDLVVLCTHDRRGVRRLLQGSVARDLARATPAPLLVVHPRENWKGPTKFRRILVAIDGSHRSAAVVPEVTEIARAFGSAVVLFVAMPPSEESLQLPTNVVTENVVRLRRELTEKGIDTDIAIWSGDPARAILDYVEGGAADCVALSTHGRSGLERFLFGSVAETLLKKGRVPLLIKRAPVEKPAAKAPAGERAQRALKSMEMMATGPKGPYNRA